MMTCNSVYFLQTAGAHQQVLEKQVAAVTSAVQELSDEKIRNTRQGERDKITITWMKHYSITYLSNLTLLVTPDNLYTMLQLQAKIDLIGREERDSDGE